MAFVCLLLAHTCLYAQPGQPAVGSVKPAVTAHLVGKVVDEKGAPVSFAKVIILQNRYDSATARSKDFFFKGMSSERNGEFSFEYLPVAGKLKLLISSLGYDNVEQPISFNAQNGNKGIAVIEQDLGSITLKESTRALKEATITAMQSTMKLEIDKRVFNVNQNIVSSGGTGLDVMKNVPGVKVDIDGNVTLRNGSPQIFLDGRPTTLTIDQIPADAIESVEVITNPSAKYDASGGGAGILNIILKKNRKTGYNGNARAGINQNGEANLGGDFNILQNKINFTGSLNARLNNGRNYGTLNRTNFNEGIAAAQVTQTSSDKIQGGMVFGKMGIDYFMTNRTTFSVSGVKMAGVFKPLSVLDMYTDSMLYQGTSFSQRHTDSERKISNNGLVFGMKHLFKKEGEELSFDANYFAGTNASSTRYTTDYYQGGAGTAINKSTLQKIEGTGSDENLVLQSDYVRPFSSKFRLETGLRAALRSRVNTNNNYIYSPGNLEYVLQYSPASNYRNNDQVYAAYLIGSGSMKDFGYKLGLRAERSDYAAELTDTKQTFGNHYPLSLFPTLFFSEKLNSNQDLQLSFTRSVKRPNFMQLIPFTDSTDKYNISRGNPALRPEFTESVELSYMKRFKKGGSFLSSLYYKYTNNLITRYIEQEANGTLINTYVNANQAYATGVEFTHQYYFSRWMDLTSNLNLFNSRVNPGNGTGAAPAALWSWYGKVNSNIRLPKSFTVQLSGMYQSKTNIPASNQQGGGPGGAGGPGGGPYGMQAQSSSQGYIQSYWAVDVAVKKTFLKDKLALTLSMNDIFKTRYNTIVTESVYFNQAYSRINNPQILRLNVLYSFGKLDAQLFKRKTKGTGEDISQ